MFSGVPVRVRKAYRKSFSYPIGYYLRASILYQPLSGTFSMPVTSPVADFVRTKRKLLGLSQPELARNAGVGWRFVRELEAGKATLRVDKVNQVLALFGHELAPTPAPRPEE